MTTATAIAKGEEQRVVARPLKVLVPLIQEDLQRGREAAERAGLPYYQAAGEKLLEAKVQLKHGEFARWCERNFTVGERQLRRYMALAEHTQNGLASPFSSLSEYVRATSDPNYNARIVKPDYHSQVERIVERVDTETLNLKRDELKRAEEREAQRALALQLIDIGFKVLAKALHPDKGGSREAMARLNAVRKRLMDAA